MIDWELQPAYRQIKNVIEPSVKQGYHAALFNHKGQLIHVMGANPLHFFGFSQSVQNLQKYFKLSMDEIIITNDPAFGSPRLCDINFIKGIFNQNELRGFVVVQMTLEGLLNNKNLLSAKSIDDEGFKIPPTPLDKKGEIKEALLNYLSESKIPRGELDERFKTAFQALNEIGLRYLTLEKKWGRQFLQDKLQSLENYTEDIFQKSLHRFPDGEISFNSKLGSDNLATRIRVREKSFIIDFAGTAKQSSRSMQCHYSITLSSCFWFFLSFLGEEVPINEGCLRALSVEAPIGSLVNPTGNYPSFEGYYSVSTAICHNLFKIMQKALPREIENFQFKESLTFLVQTPNYVFIESLAPGQEANSLHSGFNAIRSDWNNQPGISVEEMEKDLNLSIESLGLNLRAEKTFQKKGGLGVHLKMKNPEGSKIKILCGAESAITKNITQQDIAFSTANGLDWGQKDLDD